MNIGDGLVHLVPVEPGHIVHGEGVQRDDVGIAQRGPHSLKVHTLEPPGTQQVAPSSVHPHLDDVITQVDSQGCQEDGRPEDDEEAVTRSISGRCSADGFHARLV